MLTSEDTETNVKVMLLKRFQGLLMKHAVLIDQSPSMQTLVLHFLWECEHNLLEQYRLFLSSIYRKLDHGSRERNESSEYAIIFFETFYWMLKLSSVVFEVVQQDIYR